MKKEHVLSSSKITTNCLIDTNSVIIWWCWCSMFVLCDGRHLWIYLYSRIWEIESFKMTEVSEWNRYMKAAHDCFGKRLFIICALNLNTEHNLPIFTYLLSSFNDNDDIVTFIDYEHKEIKLFYVANLRYRSSYLFHGF